jgi:hypothetical protein
MFMKRLFAFLFALLLPLAIAAPYTSATSFYPTVYYEVSGQAQVTEATYHYRVKVRHNVIQEGYGQTSNGAPAWGDFKQIIKLSAKDKKKAILELYSVSMEDGKELHKLVIPLHKSAGKVYSNQSFRNVRVYELK